MQKEFSNAGVTSLYINLFNLQEAWQNTIQYRELPLSQVVSPLMTSMNCLRAEETYFSNGFKIEGRDILDRSPQQNPLFHDYNHVVIPYCSSDGWLGEDEGHAGDECDCFDFDSCFPFDPSNETLQFTFRGKVIAQSIISQLIDSHNLTGDGHIIVAGSGVGGLGVVNHAKWIKERLGSSADVSLIIDSSWFVNYQGSILQNFLGTQSLATVQNDTNRLLQNYQKHKPCRDVTLGYPCCFAAHCVMTTRDSEGQLAYFSKDLKTFAISSKFDTYSLASAASQLSLDNNISKLLSTVRESGLQLDTTLTLSSKQVYCMAPIVSNILTRIVLYTLQLQSLSYYLTECFQHLYFATSTLWGELGVLGSKEKENIVRIPILRYVKTSIDSM